MKKTVTLLLIISFIVLSENAGAWGFFAHRKINRMAVMTLPPQMQLFYKANINYITSHATDPDKLRYALSGEAPHHFIDIDHYCLPPFSCVPHQWDSAVAKYGQDTLLKYGVVPWHAEKVYQQLISAFKQKNKQRILKLSAFLGHYIADANVPLHASTNYDGQLSGQEGIHALWESRIPELLADSTFYLWTGKAEYIDKPAKYIWEMVIASGKAADTVLRAEKKLLTTFQKDKIYSFAERNNNILRNYSNDFVEAYNQQLHGMVARQMRRSIHAVASLWYTAWVNAGQPDLQNNATISNVAPHR